LEALAAQHSIIGDIRGCGFFVGVELVRDPMSREPATAETRRVVNGLRERRVRISASGPFVNILKIRPPLPFSRTNADLFLSTLDNVFKGL
jgi:4-aminobutyrate aminotransferase-like enzyme